jgi:uncharacterized phage protein (TIGR01671 family)
LQRANDIIITQFTGLEDKSGNEIYEGDIIQFARKKGRTNRQFKAIITFKHGCFVMEKLNTRIKSFVTFLDYDVDFIEILGNIFENKELLEQG